MAWAFRVRCRALQGKEVLLLVSKLVFFLDGGVYQMYIVMYSNYWSAEALLCVWS